MASRPFWWRGSLGQYSTKQKRVLRFFSEEEIRRAIHLCWEDPEFTGMPRGYCDDLSIVAPEEAVELFQARGGNFRVSEYLTRSDYRRAQLIDKEDNVAIDDFVTKYWSENPKRINYFERDGVLWFGYEERVLDLKTEWRERWKIYKTEGEIPRAIVAGGQEAIKAFVEEKITAYLLDAREREFKHEAYASNLNFPVSYTHQGVLLQGRIVSALDSTLLVRLQEPYQGERSVHFGFGSAMAGRFIFDREDKLTQAAVDAAQRWMIYIYEEKDAYRRNKGVIDLANKLNSRK